MPVFMICLYTKVRIHYRYVLTETVLCDLEAQPPRLLPSARIRAFVTYCITRRQQIECRSLQAAAMLLYILQNKETKT